MRLQQKTALSSATPRLPHQGGWESAGICCCRRMTTPLHDSCLDAKLRGICLKSRRGSPSAAVSSETQTKCPFQELAGRSSRGRYARSSEVVAAEHCMTHTTVPARRDAHATSRRHRPMRHRMAPKSGELFMSCKNIGREWFCKCARRCKGGKRKDTTRGWPKKSKAVYSTPAHWVLGVQLNRRRLRIFPRKQCWKLIRR